LQIFLTSVDFFQRLLQTLIQPNGSGSWLLGYLPVRVAAGGYVLQSKYYFQQGDTPPEGPVEEGSAPPTSTALDPPSLLPFSSLPSFSSIHSEKDSEPVSDCEDARCYSKQCARLMMETAVRVVELLPHPLGRRELVVVLEFVHNNHWSANTRFVSLDVFKIGQAILLAGQPPPHFLSKLDIMDKMVSQQRNLSTAKNYLFLPFSFAITSFFRSGSSACGTTRQPPPW